MKPLYLADVEGRRFLRFSGLRDHGLRWKSSGCLGSHAGSASGRLATAQMALIDPFRALVSLLPTIAKVALGGKE
jgi:hypothetical protein